MSISCEIHHFGILASDVSRSARTYREALGLELAPQWLAHSGHEDAMVGGDREGQLQLHGRPLAPSEGGSGNARRSRIDHVHYETEHLDAAFAELRSRGLEATCEPTKVGDARVAGFRDPMGLPFELISFHTARRSPAGSPRNGHSPRARWQHVSMVVPDLRRAQSFYQDALGLRIVYEFTKDDGGFVLLGTEAFGTKGEFLLEVIGPPGLEAREERILNELGPCYDHCCVEVEDVEAAWDNAVRLGMDAVRGQEPRHYPEYPADIGWVRDPDGVDVEIMSSSTTRHVLDRFRRRERDNAWIEPSSPLA